MRVLVTGGTGDVGRAAVARLVEHGHTVRVMGRRPAMSIPGAEYITGDVTDFGQMRRAAEGMEGIVHLAAIRNPALGWGQDIFSVNTAGTFNAYQAAAEVGIKRVVSASSINALGYNFGVHEFPLEYLPIDEAHPTCTTDPYSFSKQVVEEIGAYFWRRDGISGVALRLPAVYEAEGDTAQIHAFIAESRATYERFLALPEAERRAQADRVIDRFEAMREERVWEYPRANASTYQEPDNWLIVGRSNLWASIDARDSAQAIEKALLADYEGCHPLFINDSHNFACVESRVLAAIFFPNLTTWKRPVYGTETLVSIDQARALLGFEPEHSVCRYMA